MKRQFFLAYCKMRRKDVLRFFCFCIIFAVVFLLYRLPFDAVIYPTLLCSGLGLLFFLADYRKAYVKHCRLVQMLDLPAEVMDWFPAVETVSEADYQAIVKKLRKDQGELAAKLNGQYEDLMDYYTTWVHQIKMPIAAMGLYLQGEDTTFSHKIARELQRIEEYVEMVLVYLRLDADDTDYLLKELDLDSLVRGAVRKFSTQFIQGRIRLDYAPIEGTVISDEKWLTFVLEQVLSNALKYTPEGGVIRIYLTAPKTLCVTDTGMGIAEEDLPRVFAKGYTGYNGRKDKRASGIGLYLCREICHNLGHNIRISSVLGEGTTVEIDLQQGHVTVE